MSWENGTGPAATQPEPAKETVAEPAKDAAPTEKPPEVKAEPVVESGVAPADDLVPQKVLGKVAKAIREKSRGDLAQKDAELRALREENEKLRQSRENGVEASAPAAESEEDARIRVRVREEFLRQQDEYGKEKYGERYQEAIDVIKAQNDPQLMTKIQWSANPVEALMSEATRIAEEVEFGKDPVERDKRREADLKAKLRKEIEAEYQAKLAAMGKQPTDVHKIRAAGGDDRPAPKVSSWGNSLPD